MSTAAARRPARSRAARQRVALAGALFAVAWLTAARAASADSVADAKDLFARGRELRRSGDCSSAIWAFRKAYDLYPEGLGSLRNVAECEEVLGRFASSRRDWMDLRRALGNNPPDRYDGWARDAEEAAARLAPKLSTLRVDLTSAGIGADATRAGVRVKINDEWLSPTMFGTPLERDPGRYIVRIVRSGALDEVRSIDLGPGDAKTVSVASALGPGAAVAREPVPASATENGVVPSGEDRARADVWPALGWTGVGIGAASLTAAGVSWLVLRSAIGDLETQCPRYRSEPCPSSVQSIENRGRTASTLAYVFGVTGFAAAAGGIVLLVTHSRRGAPSLQAAAGLSADGVWAAGRF